MSIKKYAVIGHPIGHTMSPFIHSRLFELSGIKAEYGVIDIAPENLEQEYKNTLKKLDGFNITIPHKQNIIKHIDGLDKKAELYGSVNTVDFKNGTATGYTTDPDGFLKALASVDIKLQNRVVILGCGGVARTMAYEAVLAGSDLTLAVRPDDFELGKALCKELSENFPNAKADCCLISQLSGDIDVLINATPVGMFPKTQAQPVSDSVIAKTAALFDAVYNPLETVLVQKALANGSKAIGGMSMLVWQAVVAHEIWDGSTYDTDEVNKICLDASEYLKNK